MSHLRFPRPPRIALVLATACLSAPVLAQQQPGGATPWGLGIGIASTQRPYTGASSKQIPFPNLSYENEYVRIAGIAADLKLGSAGPVQFAVGARYALADGYKAGDAPVLAGMQTRDASVWVGPSLRWNAGIARVSFELLGDALGKSNGLQARLGIQRDFRAGSFLFTPHAAAQFVDRKYVGYYYGVTLAEANASRSAYGGKSTVNLELGLRSAFMIDASSSVFADIGAKALGKGITDSPLVDRKVTPLVVLGYLYRF